MKSKTTTNTDPKRVFVGVSGGVDSSVAAALLKQEGHEVVGVFIRTWHPDWAPCDWQDDRRDAMRVCAHLDIPFFELDLEQDYKQGVADYMIAEYKSGRTPNPDVMCNKAVKFGGFLRWAKRHGADYIATGHYARRRVVSLDTEQEGSSGGQKYELLRGLDGTKDQSYFLWTLTQEQLSSVLFPIGEIPKTQVRKLATQFGLPTAQKKDSQGICFLGQVDMKDFLRRYIDVTPGDVLDSGGAVIGRHEGAVLYTLGERRGFETTNHDTRNTPYYVVAKDLEHNTITVSHNPDHYRRQSRKLRLRQANLVGGFVDVAKSYQAQFRYHGELLWVDIEGFSGDEMVVTLQTDDPTIANGQSLVLYDNHVCIGGGVIDATL